MSKKKVLTEEEKREKREESRIRNKNYRAKNKEKFKLLSKNQREREKNKDKEGYILRSRAYGKKAYRKHRRKRIEGAKLRSSKNKSLQRQYSQKHYLSNREELLIKFKIYRIENKEEIRLQRKSKRIEINRKAREKYSKDDIYKLRTLISGRISRGLKKNKNIVKKNQSRTLSYTGCNSWGELLNKILKRSNLLKYTKGYDLDHIVPISFAKNKDEIIKLNHWTNLRLIPASENKRKSNKINTQEQFDLILSLLGREYKIKEKVI